MKTALHDAAVTSQPVCPHCQSVLRAHPGTSGLLDCKGCGAEIDPSSVPQPGDIAAVAELGASPLPAQRTLGRRPRELTVTERASETQLEWLGAHEFISWLTVVALIVLPGLAIALPSDQAKVVVG